MKTVLCSLILSLGLFAGVTAHADILSFSTSSCYASTDCTGDALAQNIFITQCPAGSLSYLDYDCGGTGCNDLCYDVKNPPHPSHYPPPPTTEPGCPKGTSLTYDCGGTGCGYICE